MIDQRVLLMLTMGQFLTHQLSINNGRLISVQENHGNFLADFRMVGHFLSRHCNWRFGSQCPNYV